MFKKIAFKNIENVEQLTPKISDGVLSVGSQYKHVSRFLFEPREAIHFKNKINVKVKMNYKNDVGFIIVDKVIKLDDEIKIENENKTDDVEEIMASENPIQNFINSPTRENSVKLFESLNKRFYSDSEKYSYTKNN